MRHHPALIRPLSTSRPPARYVAGACAFIALNVGAIDLLQGASWPAALTLGGLTFATSAAPILALLGWEGA